MEKNRTKVGFIGAGYMGYGMAYNLLTNNYNLSVIANKNRLPINKLLNQGALESNTFKDLAEFADVIIMCVTDTLVAIEIVNKLLPYLKSSSLFIDITTHHSSGSIEVNNLLKINL